MANLYAQVVVFTGFDKALTYQIPGDLHGKLEVGHLVKVPLRNRIEYALVTSLCDSIDFDSSKVKPIHSVMYEEAIVTGELLQLAFWVYKYYAASFESVLEALVPSVIRKGVSEKKDKYLSIEKGLEEGELESLRKRSPKQALVYEYLAGCERAVKKSDLLKFLNVTASVCDSLCKKGIIVEEVKVLMRDAYNDSVGQSEVVYKTCVELNDQQGMACESIRESLEKKKFQTHLLHGVTGSGKTEVYLQSILDTLKEGGGVIFLVPEVVLTPQTAGRLRARLDSEGVASVVWHSGLSAGERYDAWFSLLKGEAKVVVGARSAVFAPVQNLKLIIVDEEHEPSYKQGDSPRYHGRDVAVYRAMLNDAVCVLGSATPSLESLYNVEHKGYIANRLTKRIDDRLLPTFHVVDMKREILSKEGSLILSKMLADKLRDRFEKKEQSILFINRRGFSSSILCLDCGHVEMCPSCSVTLTYHKAGNKMRCHLCDHSQNAAVVCPKCKSKKIKGKGLGTQRVEDVVQKLLPSAKIVRIDADTMSKKNQFREILADFRTGKIDVLVGTQMIAKGLDFPNVTLVGMIDADLSMHVPDFRAHERTFQLLVQVSGRAGRGDRAGEVVVQTFTPQSAAIQFARHADFDGFLEEELQTREEYSYPPYRNIIRHIFRGEDELKVRKSIDAWADFLEKNLGESVDIKGPSPAPIERLKSFYRYHLWIFTNNVSKTIPRVLELKNSFKFDSEVIDVLVVDPIDSL